MLVLLRGLACVCLLAYLAAALTPCPQPLPQAAPEADRIAAEPSHAGHSHGTLAPRLNAHGLPVLPINHDVVPEASEPGRALASLSAVCTCGCGERPSATPNARLGLALPGSAPAPSWILPRCAAAPHDPFAPAPPPATPDHVPIASSTA